MTDLITPSYRKGRPAADYRGAHVLDPGGRLAEIVAVRYEEHGAAGYRAEPRRFNGEPAGECPLYAVRILPRDYPTTDE